MNSMGREKSVTYVGAVLATAFLAGCGTFIDIPVLYNSNYFHIVGDVVDENGRPVDVGVMVEESDFVSVTMDRYFGNHLEPAPNGRFDINSGPCESILLGFGGNGLQWQQLCCRSMTEIPKPLHIVLHKYVAPMPVKLDPVGTFEVKAADLHFTKMAWSDVVLTINADGTASSVTTMSDGKTLVRGTGRWSFTPPNQSGVIKVEIQKPAGAPDPEQMADQPNEFALSLGDDANRRLIKYRGAVSFVRIK